MINNITVCIYPGCTQMPIFSATCAMHRDNCPCSKWILWYRLWRHIIWSSQSFLIISRGKFVSRGISSLHWKIYPSCPGCAFSCFFINSACSEEVIVQSGRRIPLGAASSSSPFEFIIGFKVFPHQWILIRLRGVLQRWLTFPGVQ